MGLKGEAAIVGIAELKPERKFTGTPKLTIEQWAELSKMALDDAGIPLDTVWDMQDKLKAAGGKSSIHVYDDAPHAFHADYRPSYRKDHAEDGWKRMQAWFRQNGV